MHRLKAALGLALVVFSVPTLLAAPATADPPHRTVPRPADLVGVGGDITEDLFNQLSSDDDPHGRTAHSGSRLFSFDSVGSPSVRTKAGCGRIARPDGSSAGITALENREILPNGRPCIDFARATRPVLPGDAPNLRTVPIVLDVVDWVANAGGNAPASLTQDQLAAIYQCRATTWDQVGGTSTARIEPMLPAVGPGISAFLTLAFGITFADLGPCVFQGVQQDDGTDPRIAGNPNALVVYSVGKYLGQAVYHHNDKHGTLRLGRIAGRSAAVFNSSSNRVEINIGQVAGVPPMLTPFVIEQFVAYLADGNGNPPPGVRDLFVGPDSWLCTNRRAQADIADFGFLPLPPGLCGIG
jgi:ABC-type phosphate transport system substrate-binding protein